jgi:hypothetical protein
MSVMSGLRIACASRMPRVGLAWATGDGAAAILRSISASSRVALAPRHATVVIGNRADRHAKSSKARTIAPDMAAAPKQHAVVTASAWRYHGAKCLMLIACRGLRGGVGPRK